MGRYVHDPAPDKTATFWTRLAWPATVQADERPPDIISARPLATVVKLGNTLVVELEVKAGEAGVKVEEERKKNQQNQKAEYTATLYIKDAEDKTVVGYSTRTKILLPRKGGFKK